MSDPKKIEAPKVTLPSGGGALRGIGEPFKAQDFTGAAGFSIPLPTPSGRGFAPSLSLEYNSGNGNGIFGLGFAMPIGAVTLKTSNGIPKYDGQDGYLMAGAGELIVAYQTTQDGNWLPETQVWASPEGVAYQITCYRPRIEGAFDRIEQWQNKASQEIHWRVVTSDNVTHIYGDDSDCRVADPQNALHVFEWLISSSQDAHGNRIQYQYRPEDGVAVPDTLYNVGRDRSAQRYLWRISYGNYVDATRTAFPGLLPPPLAADQRFAFHICLDYGQIDAQDPNAPWTDWSARPDPFSTYKSGFEIRTWRQCHGVYLQQHFVGENGGAPYVTQATLLSYHSTDLSAISLVERVWQRGYRLQADGALWQEESPAMELYYQPFAPTAHDWKNLDAHIPGAMGQQGFMAVDIYGEGIDGLLWSDAHYTGYMRPLGKGKFAPIAPLPVFPNDRNFDNGTLRFSSVNGNSVLDLVVENEAMTGFFAAKADGGWQSFQPFLHLPQDYSNPNKEFVDVDGSGKSSILLYDGEALKTYPSEGQLGYQKAEYAKRPALFPATQDSGETEVLAYADVFGDGLPHRVRIRNGSVEAWPCLGHGHFGNVVSFGNAPTFPPALDANRLQLIDTDGSGALDIVYLLPDKMRIWVNQNGNAFAAPVDVALPSQYGPLSQVTPGDFTGFGTASLLLTQLAPSVSHQYYDFAGNKKPYLLTERHNGMGGKTEIQYTTSVLEYFRDQEEGRPWPTRLPFPVHLTQKVIVHDLVVGSRFAQRHRYHDGYFDPVEREFRGFGFVETWDTEDYADFTVQLEPAIGVTTPLDKALWVPPIHTKSWFLTGAAQQTEALLRSYEAAYFQGDAAAWQIAPFTFASNLAGADAATMEQAFAAMAGHNIRSEVYAIDGSAVAQNPYSVQQSTIAVSLQQPMLQQPYACFQMHESQSLTYDYERNPMDPQIAQSLVLSVDPYGNPLLTASVAYPRRPQANPTVYFEQSQLHCVVAAADYIYAAADPTHSPRDFWQIWGVNWQGKSYEIGGILPPVDAPFTTTGLLDLVNAALSNPVTDAAPAASPWSRLRAWNRSYFWDADQDAALPGGGISALALLHSSAAAIMTPDSVSQVFGDKVSDAMLQYQGGYVLQDGYWWNCGLVQFYHKSPAQFYLPWRTGNPIALQNIADGKSPENGLDVQTSSLYDRYWMYVVETAAHLSPTVALRTIAEIDYQALQPWRLIDANDNVSEVLLDPIGKVIASTSYGKLQGRDVGDLPLSQYNLIANPTLEAVLADPAQYLQGATQYFYYDLRAWQDKENPQPTSAIALQRMEHVYDGAGNALPQAATRVQIAISYSDGMGQAMQTRALVSEEVGTKPVFTDQAAKSMAASAATTGKMTSPEAKANLHLPKIYHEIKMHPDGLAGDMGQAAVDLAQSDGEPQTPAHDIVRRWLVSGRVVYNNKGKPTEQYDPYFSDHYLVEDQASISLAGLVPPPSIVHYDPAGRVIKTSSPKGFFSKTVFTAWATQSYDANDTVLDSAYYQWFVATYPDPQPGWQMQEWQSLQAAVKCDGTPSTIINDNLGRAIRIIADNLGAVGQNAIPEKVALPDSPATAWQQLIAFGYLVVDPNNATQAWVTSTFQPYTQGFSSQFLTQFPSNGEKLEAWLAQQCLTSMAEYDISGNVQRNADARLFAEMLRTGNPHYNFEYQYDMADGVLYTKSVDAGERWTLRNIFGNLIYNWDSRGFTFATDYDRLQRPVSTTVTGGDGEAPLDNVVDGRVYGDALPDAAQSNLRGQLYQHYDAAGCSTFLQYGLDGQVLKNQQQVRPDYVGDPNWSAAARAAIAHEPALQFASTYDAIGNLRSNTTPDGSVTRQAYAIGGQLIRSWQEILGTDGQVSTVMVEEILGYDSSGNRTLVTYGNGVQSRMVYDALTKDLMLVRTTRPGSSGPEELRALAFTYDPVGHKLTQTDLVSAPQYTGHATVPTTAQYTYDPLYRLITATGKTLPSLNQSQAGNRDILAGIGHHFATLADLQSLEQYTRTFAYDAGGNLVLQRHQAPSGSWTQVNAIAQGSNRLQTQAFGNPSDHKMMQPDWRYDADGNALDLYAGSKAQVSWNYQNQIARVTLIARSAVGPDGNLVTLDDAEYYVYGATGSRSRKVTERMQHGGKSVRVTDKFYFGNYEVKKTYTRSIPSAGVHQGTTLETPNSEKRTLHGMDGGNRITTTDIWVVAPQKVNAPKTGEMQTRYSLSDGLNSVTMQLTDQAVILSYEEYYPYGGTAFTISASQLEADAKEYRFCGKECDAATGLYDYGARYYATWTCRWMSPDPAGTVDGPNLYAYVGGDPVGYNDPTGMAREHAAINRANIRSQKLSDIVKVKGAQIRRYEAKFAEAGTTINSEVLDKYLKAKKVLNVLKDAYDLSRRNPEKFSRKPRIVKKASKLLEALRSSARMSPSLIKSAYEQHLSTYGIARTAYLQFKAPPAIGTPLPAKKNAVAPDAIANGLTTSFTNQKVLGKGSKIDAIRHGAGGQMQESAGDYSGRKNGFHEAWLHLISHMFGGEESPKNMVAGSAGANGIMTGIETAVRDFLEKHDIEVTIRVTAEVYVNSTEADDHTHVAKSIFYEILTPVRAEDGSTVHQVVFKKTIDATLESSQGLQKEARGEVLKALRPYR